MRIVENCICTLYFVSLMQCVSVGDGAPSTGSEEETSLSAFYRIERNLRHALKPEYEVLFERLNTHPGGLKFLSNLRADILSIIA